MQHLTHELQSDDNLPLYAQSWAPDEPPKAVLTLSHGQAEHSGRYRHLAEALVEAGYSLFMGDLRGHGQSDGKRGHTESFTAYIRDYVIFLQVARRLYPDAVHFFGGHSMGGLVALYYALGNPPGYAGAVISSAFVGLSFEPPRWRVMLGRMMANFAPAFSQPTGLDPAGLTHDQAVVQAYIDDPLVHGEISASAFISILRTQEEVIEQASKIVVPVYFLHGTADPIASYEAAHAVYEAASSEDKTFATYEGLYHELLNENEKEQVITALIAWLDDHTT